MYFSSLDTVEVDIKKQHKGHSETYNTVIICIFPQPCLRPTNTHSRRQVKFSHLTLTSTYTHAHTHTHLSAPHDPLVIPVWHLAE